MSDVLWTLQQVGLGTGNGMPSRLHDVSLDLVAGTTAVLGPSGAGKTSLLNLLVEFERPHTGTATRCLQTVDDRIAVYWVPQTYGLWPHLTVGEHLQLAAATGVSVQWCRDLAAQLHIADKWSSTPTELSQGARARLSVARALTTKPSVLVMDEPFTGVDLPLRTECWNVVREIVRADNISMVFSTHDPETVLTEAIHVLCLRRGSVIYDGSVTELYARAPSAELARYLAHVNWLPTDAATEWLDPTGPVPEHPCCRAEQIAAEPTENGHLQVTTVRPTGPTAEVQLQNPDTGKTRKFWCRRPDTPLRAGDRVLLRLLFSVLFAALMIIGSGCKKTHEPSLLFDSESHWSMSADGSRIPGPRGVAVNDKGEIFVIDTAARISVLSADGDHLRQWRMPETEVGTPEDLTVLANGNIAVPDTHYNRVIIFNDQGQVVKQFGSLGRKPGQFIYPVSLTEDNDGTLYVCEYGSNDRVQVFTGTGDFVRVFGSFGTGLGQFQRPSGIVWRNGLLYISDAANHRVQVFSDTGKFLRVLDRPTPDTERFGLRFPYDIALDTRGNLLVIEWGAGRLTQISDNGTLLGRYGTPGNATGMLCTPWGVATDNANRILIADTGNRRIVVLQQ